MKRGCSCGTITLVLLAIIAGALFWIAYPTLFAPPIKPEETPWPDQLQLIKRSEWGNPAIANPDDIDPMNGVKMITIHHDGLPPLAMKTEAQIKSRIVSIRKSHSTKYADIGYHYIVDPLGRVWEGRPVIYQGAHVQGHNNHNIGILFLGNTNDIRPTVAGEAELYTLIRYLRQRHVVPKDKILTHGELAATDCPGKFLQEDIEEARVSGDFDIEETGGLNFDIDALVEQSKAIYQKIRGMIKS